MRLNSLHRDAFINAVMADVPVVDYYDQAQKIVQEFQVRHMPKEVQAVYKKPELRGYLKEHCARFHFNRYGYFSVYGDAGLDDATTKSVRDLMNLNDQQDNRIRSLRNKLESVLASVTTRKSLIEALPEFEKYAPPEAEPLSRSVPALANVVSDFVAAGWPKEKPKAAPLPKRRSRDTASK